MASLKLVSLTVISWIVVQHSTLAVLSPKCSIENHYLLNSDPYFQVGFEVLSLLPVITGNYR